MKVLSLTEPYATLIKDGKKKIETRSWKTNYRGKLYIHSSSTKMPNEYKNNKDLMSLVDIDKLNYGNIICSCELVDCIEMTNKFIEKVRQNKNEYISGEYAEGRYAWILKDIQVLDKPIKAKGQLNVWDYHDEKDVMKLMNDIEYGWVDKYNKKHFVVDNTYSENYILQKPQEIIKNKIGVCWDQVELERYYFKGNDWNITTYFIVHYDDNKCPTHTFLTYEKNNKYYWFEHSWEIFRGIHEYNSITELLNDVKDKFIKYELNDNFTKSKLCIYNYSKPKNNISTQEFYKHCEKGYIIKLEE